MREICTSGSVLALFDASSTATNTILFASHADIQDFNAGTYEVRAMTLDNANIPLTLK